jgi:hypothetical protein
MPSVLKAMQSKSDQLNYVDVGDGSLIALIERVDVTNSDQQPITVHFSGCNGKPYKPNKGMIRVLAGAWGEDSDSWIGKTVKIIGDKTVKWGGEEVGGLVVGALSHVDKGGYTAYIQKNKRVRVKQTIPLLVVEVQYYSEERFDSDKMSMAGAIKGGQDTLGGITKSCNLSPRQVEELTSLSAE